MYTCSCFLVHGSILICLVVLCLILMSLFVSYQLREPVDMKNVTYYSYRGRFSESTKLVTVHKGRIAPRGKQTWNRELLSVPTVPPSHLRGCKIIDVQYSIELCIKPSGIARKVKLPVDIVIGTVALKDQQHKVTCHPLLSPGDANFPFPFFSANYDSEVFLTDLSLHNMLPTAPPWEEDDDIP